LEEEEQTKTKKKRKKKEELWNLPIVSWIIAFDSVVVVALLLDEKKPEEIEKRVTSIL
jgi:hypothetical protein